jgi:hypothetical protein
MRRLRVALYGERVTPIQATGAGSAALPALRNSAAFVFGFAQNPRTFHYLSCKERFISSLGPVYAPFMRDPVLCTGKGNASHQRNSGMLKVGSHYAWLGARPEAQPVREPIIA